MTEHRSPQYGTAEDMKFKSNSTSNRHRLDLPFLALRNIFLPIRTFPRSVRERKIERGATSTREVVVVSFVEGVTNGRRGSKSQCLNGAYSGTLTVSTLRQRQQRQVGTSASGSQWQPVGSWPATPPAQPSRRAESSAVACTNDITSPQNSV